MAVNGTAAEEAAELLACGRDAAQVWDHAEAGREPDAHERDCPYCRAAYADARRLEATVHRMARESVEPPPSVLDAVMGAVRREPRPEEPLVLEAPLSPDRPNYLAHAAAAGVLRAVVDTMDGLRARSCRITQPDSTQPGGAAAEVALTVAARFGMDLAAATARVRRMVLAAGEQALGIPVRRVDIEVADLWDA